MLFFSTWAALGGRAFRAAALAGVVTWVVPLQPAEAQGLLDLLFGGPKPAPVAVPLPRGPQGTSGAYGGVFHAEPKRALSDADGERSGGTFRTVCVRMCDGFFVPMSYATTRANFQQDQNKCQATCGSDARLFFHRNPGGAMEEAVDLSGRVYGRIPNAFRFRKTLVEGCACRPPPWSEAELARHRAYAVGPQSPVAGQPLKPQTKVADAGAVVDAASAVIVSDAPQSAPPVLKPAKTRTASRAAPEAPRVVRAAVAAPGIAKVPQSSPSGGLFGYGGSSSMGLTGKSKYVWPGD
jgi:hypothetical protein